MSKITGTPAQRRARLKFRGASTSLRRKWAAKAARTRCARRVAACRADARGAVEGLSETEIVRATPSLHDSNMYEGFENPYRRSAGGHVELIEQLYRKGPLIPRHKIVEMAEAHGIDSDIAFQYWMNRRNGQYSPADALRMAKQGVSHLPEDMRRRSRASWTNPCAYENPRQCRRCGVKIPEARVVPLCDHCVKAVRHKTNRRPTASNPELLVWSSEGGNMLPVSANPGLEIEMAENPKKRTNRKKRGSRKARSKRSSHHRRKKAKKNCMRICRIKHRHIKRGKRLLTWKAATRRYGVTGAIKYKRKFGIKKLTHKK